MQQSLWVSQLANFKDPSEERDANIDGSIDMVKCNVSMHERSIQLSEPIYSKWLMQEIQIHEWVKTIHLKFKIDWWILI